MIKLPVLVALLLVASGVSAQNEALAPGALGIQYTPDMQMCGDSLHGFPTLQYYQLNVKNAKSSPQILSEWRNFFQPAPGFKESGFLVIRFVLNCQGQPRIHRFYEMDLEYHPKTFPESLKTQLWRFVQQLGGFPQGEYTKEDKKNAVNYYYYFIFKIRNGTFESVAP